MVRIRIQPKQFLIAVDQLINTCIDKGFADEAISARAWRRRNDTIGWGRLRRLIDALWRLFGAKDHCYQSYLSELHRRQLPPEYRQPAGR